VALGRIYLLPPLSWRCLSGSAVTPFPHPAHRYPASAVLRTSPPPQGAQPCPSRASGWSSRTTHWGFLCCSRFPCVHAAANTPVQQLGVFFAHLPAISFPDMAVGSAYTSSFSAFSAFTGVAACIHRNLARTGLKRRCAIIGCRRCGIWELRKGNNVVTLRGSDPTLLTDATDHRLSLG
jgi:hypothetical protein